MFPLSLTGDAAIWFTELFKILSTLWKLRDVFLARYYPVSNIVALPRESMSSSKDRFTAFLKGVPNNRINDVSLKEYFYKAQDDNNKDKVNNFVKLSDESVSSSRDRFTAFVRSIRNHHIDDESLKEYFFRCQGEHNKAMLDTNEGGSYVE